jgi:hypothetical protein
VQLADRDDGSPLGRLMARHMTIIRLSTASLYASASISTFEQMELAVGGACARSQGPGLTKKLLRRPRKSEAS